VDLTEHLRIMWRRKWRILGVALTVAILVYAHGKATAKTYASEGLLTVTSAQASAGETGGQEATLFLAATYARLAETDPVVADAVKRSGLPISVATAKHRLSSSAASDVGFLTIRATGPTPGDARKLAQAGADALIQQVTTDEANAVEQRVQQLQPQIDAVQSQLQGMSSDDPARATLEAQFSALIQKRTDIQTQPTDQIELKQKPDTPAGPIAPTPLRDALLAFIVALVINAELWVLLDVLSDRFSPENVHEGVQRATGLPVLAEIPRGAGPDVIEAFRALRTNLMFLNSRAQVRTIAIVGVEPGCGKSFTAIGLAQAASDLELPVVLVDGDLRRPVIHERLHLPVRPGLGDVRSKEDFDRVAKPVAGHPFLKVVPAGSHVADPTGLLGGGLRQVLGLIGSADLVVVDTPAAGLFADAAAIAAQCDATVVVLDARATRRRALVKLVEGLRRVQADPVGVVLNRVDPSPRTSAYYYDDRRPGEAEPRQRSLRP
jgi:capsular exopolysaccharide synthesis family protein